MKVGSDFLKRLRAALAPEGVWRLGDRMDALLKDMLRRLPRGHVSKQERRYPTTSKGMRAFLNAFFARHVFQVQDGVLSMLGDQGVSAALGRGTLRLADIGSGPAIASLAIADMLDRGLELLSANGSNPGKLRLTAVLNDPSEICLDVGKKMLGAYPRGHGSRVTVDQIIPLSAPFPKSIAQLRRLADLGKPHDLCSLSHVLDPLVEQTSEKAVVDGVRQLSDGLRGPGTGVSIIVDRFHEATHKKFCQALGSTVEERKITQRVYDSKNQNSEHTYTYFHSTCSTAGAEAEAKDSA